MGALDIVILFAYLALMVGLGSLWRSPHFYRIRPGTAKRAEGRKTH